MRTLLLVLGTMYAATALFLGDNIYKLSRSVSYQAISYRNLHTVFECIHHFHTGLGPLGPASTAIEKEMQMGFDLYSCALDVFERPTDGYGTGAGHIVIHGCVSTAAFSVNVRRLCQPLPPLLSFATIYVAYSGDSWRRCSLVACMGGMGT